MNTHWNVNVDSLSTIVDEVTTSMIGRSATRDLGAREWTGLGGWTGVVRIGAPTLLVVAVQCRRELALFAAERMLGNEQASEVVARDVLGELTSMISGNMKSLVGDLSGAPLGSPRVSIGGESLPDEAALHAPALVELRLLCGGEPLVVRLFEPPRGDA